MRRTLVVLAVAFAILSTFTVYGFRAAEQRDVGRQAQLKEQLAVEQFRRDRLEVRFEGSTEQTKALIAQVKSLGEKPIVQPDQIPGLQGLQGPPGSPGVRGPGPTREEVGFAVEAFCFSTEQCLGEDGKTGARGRGATAWQVAVAVGRYCNDRGQCRGLDGLDGSQGPPPSSDQVAQAVVAYCSENECRGPEGEDGARGEPAFPFTFTFEVPTNTAGPADDPQTHQYTVTCQESGCQVEREST